MASHISRLDYLATHKLAAGWIAWLASHFFVSLTLVLGDKTKSVQGPRSYRGTGHVCESAEELVSSNTADQLYQLVSGQSQCTANCGAGREDLVSTTSLSILG